MNILIGSPSFPDWLPGLRNINLNGIKVIIQKINEKVIHDEKIDLVIPITYDQMKYTLDNGIKAFCCDKYELCNDKKKFYKFMEESNMSNMIPKVYLDGFPKFPCIFKYSLLYAGAGSSICKNQEELDKAVKEAVPGNEYLIQEYIVGNCEYSCHLAAKNGKIIHSICYKTVNKDEYYIQHGRMKNYERVYDLPDYFSHLFEILNYTGFACIDFKIMNDQVKIFEINPRLGGTLVLNKDGLNELFEKAIQYFLQE